MYPPDNDAAPPPPPPVARDRCRHLVRGVDPSEVLARLVPLLRRRLRREDNVRMVTHGTLPISALDLHGVGNRFR